MKRILVLLIIIVLISVCGFVLFTSRNFFYIPGSQLTATYGKPFDYAHMLTTSISRLPVEGNNSLRISNKINGKIDEIIVNENTLYYVVNKNSVNPTLPKNLREGAEINLLWEEQSENSIIAKKIYIFNDL